MYLPTNLQYKLVNIQSKLSSLFGVLPFIRDDKILNYQLDWKLFIYSICTTIPLCTFQFFFVIQETIRHVLFVPNKQLSGSLIYCLVWIILFAFQHINLFLTFFKPEEFIGLLNSFKFYTKYIAVKYTNQDSTQIQTKLVKLWDRTSIFNIVLVFVCCVLGAIHFCTFPHDLFYPTRYLENWELPKAINYFLYVTYFVCFQWIILKSQLLFCFINNLGFEILIQYVPLIKNEFRIGQKLSKYHLTNDFRSLENLMIEYRASELILKIILDKFGILLIVGYCLSLLASVVCNSTLFRGKLNLVFTQQLILILTTVVLQLSWIIILYASRVAIVSSMKNILSWKNVNWGKRKERFYMAEFRKSCRPVQIGYKNHFRISRNCVLSFLWRVYRITFRTNFIYKVYDL